jgi:hypothetical protein
MATIHLHETTTATPEQFVAALTDFGPGRSQLFGNSADNYLKVHDEGPQYADVTEGSRGTWERLHYDWSDPNRVVMTTTDSNVWGGASGHTYTFTRQPDGITAVDVVVVREGKNFKGRALGSWSGSAASASWERRWEVLSRPSKPATSKRKADVTTSTRWTPSSSRSRTTPLHRRWSAYRRRPLTVHRPPLLAVPKSTTRIGSAPV